MLSFLHGGSACFSSLEPSFSLELLSLRALTLIHRFLAHVLLLPTLALFLITILWFGLTALILFFSAKWASASWPTVYYVALRAASFCKLFADLSKTYRPTSLLRLLLCPSLAFFPSDCFSGIYGRNLPFSPFPLFSGFNRFTVTHFLWTTTGPMNWPNELCFLRHLQPQFLHWSRTFNQLFSTQKSP